MSHSCCADPSFNSFGQALAQVYASAGYVGPTLSKIWTRACIEAAATAYCLNTPGNICHVRESSCMRISILISIGFCYSVGLHLIVRLDVIPTTRLFVKMPKKQMSTN